MGCFQNSNALSHAVNEEAKNQFVARPYNFYEPDQTMWWLVPSDNWPAYKHGKLFFDSRPGKMIGNAPGIHCGFEVEKGIGPTAASIYPDKVVMKPDWLWHKFISNITSDMPSLPPEQFITIGLLYEEKISEDKMPSSRLTFSLHGDQIIALYSAPDLHSSLSGAIVQHVQEKMCAQTTLEGLVEQLQLMPELDWLWVTFYIGSMATGGSPKDLWAWKLKPWNGWLK